jgi:hypothetical protein
MHCSRRMKENLAREYQEAMEEFCNLMTGLSLLAEDERGELRFRLRLAEQRCAELRAALYDARRTLAS